MTSSIGAWFEAKTYAALSEIQATCPAMVHRFPDTKSARNLIPAQPGDHLLLIHGMAILIEEKCSETHDNFRSGFSSLWPKKQVAMHRKWHRSDCPSWLLFCDYCTDNIEVWAGDLIAKARAEGKRMPINVEPIVTGTITSFNETLLHAIDYELDQKNSIIKNI